MEKQSENYDRSCCSCLLARKWKILNNKKKKSQFWSISCNINQKNMKFHSVHVVCKPSCQIDIHIMSHSYENNYVGPVCSRSHEEECQQHSVKHNISEVCYVRAVRKTWHMVQLYLPPAPLPNWPACHIKFIRNDLFLICLFEKSWMDVPAT